MKEVCWWLYEDDKGRERCFYLQEMREKKVVLCDGNNLEKIMPKQCRFEPKEEK